MKKLVILLILIISFFGNYFSVFAEDIPIVQGSQNLPISGPNKTSQKPPQNWWGPEKFAAEGYTPDGKGGYLNSKGEKAWEGNSSSEQTTTDGTTSNGGTKDDNQNKNEQGTAINESVYCSETSDGDCSEVKELKDVDTSGKPPSQDSNSDSPNNLKSANFMMDVSSLSPSQKKYTQGASNIKNLLNTITNILLIVLPTISVFLIVIGGILITISGGASEKVTKGKNIVIYNIVAIVLSLLSYSIIKIVIWLLGSTSF